MQDEVGLNLIPPLSQKGNFDFHCSANLIYMAQEKDNQDFLVGGNINSIWLSG